MTDEVWLAVLLLRKRQAAVAADSCTAQVAITINSVPFPNPQHPWHPTAQGSCVSTGCIAQVHTISHIRTKWRYSAFPKVSSKSLHHSRFHCDVMQQPQSTGDFFMCEYITSTDLKSKNFRNKNINNKCQNNLCRYFLNILCTSRCSSVFWITTKLLISSQTDIKWILTTNLHLSPPLLHFKWMTNSALLKKKSQKKP